MQQRIQQASTHAAAHAEHGSPYARLGAMAMLSFVAMFALMYAMVDAPGNVFLNVNQAYMAALMTAPMVVFELALMGRMYRRKALNAAIIVACLAALAVFWIAIRQQAFVGDAQFLRSMIPHHAGAILMCQRAPIGDPAILSLCEEILRSQQQEIARMKALLRGPAAPARADASGSDGAGG